MLIGTLIERRRSPCPELFQSLIGIHVDWNTSFVVPSTLKMFQSLIGIHVDWNSHKRLNCHYSHGFQSLIGIHVDWNTAGVLAASEQ